MGRKKKPRRRGNGEGTIYQRKDGRWVSAVTTETKDPKTGRPIPKTKYASSPEEAYQNLIEMEYLKKKKRLTHAKGLTFSEWLDIWLEDYVSCFRSSTYDSYEYNIRLHIKPDLGHIRLEGLTSNDLQRLYRKKSQNGRIDGRGGLAPRSVERIHTIIYSALEQAITNKLIPENVAKDITINRESDPIHYFTVEEQEKFIAAINPTSMIESALCTSLYSGLRRSEVLGLIWKNVNLANNTISVKKTLVRAKDRDTGKYIIVHQDTTKTKKSKRTVPIHPELKKILLRIKDIQEKNKEMAGKSYDPRGFVFSTMLGGPICPRNFNRSFYAVLKRAGLEHTNPHSLRHTFATRLLEANVHPKVVQELLGHAQLSTTTETYSHVMDWLKVEAIQSVFIEKKEKPRQRYLVIRRKKNYGTNYQSTTTESTGISSERSN